MSRPQSWTFLLIALAATSTVFVAAYWESFQVLPASDDFSYINEIHRGTREGIASFFTRSVTGQTYRPLTSVGIWAFGNLVPGYPTEGVRALHLLSAIAYAAVALLWIRAAKLGATGATLVIAIMLLHPVLPQAVGSIDGFNSLTSSAMLWLGAGFVLIWRDRPIRALLVAAICFVIGTLFKEYTFALVPLSMLTVLCFWRVRPIRHAGSFALILGGLLGMLIWVRRFTLPPDPGAHGGWEYVSSDPLQLLESIFRNAVLLASGLLFFGNSVWAYVNQSPAVFAIVGLLMPVVVGFIIWGNVMRYQASRPLDPEIEGAKRMTDGPIDPAESLTQWLLFLALSLGVASFPAILVNRVSEMYVPPLVLPLAMLCGFAADGFRRGGSIPVRALASAAAGIALISSLFTIRAKVAGLVDVGRRAETQFQQILALLPPDARDMTVCIRFLASDRQPRDLYAVFRMPDHLLLVHRIALDWKRPYHGLALDSDTVYSFSEVDPGKYDLTLGWDAQRQQFFRIE